MKRMETLWLLYRTQVIPADAGKVQVKESKRAFYAGAAALLHEQVDMLDPDTKEPTDADLRKMDDIYQELQDFNAAVAAGVS